MKLLHRVQRMHNDSSSCPLPCENEAPLGIRSGDQAGSEISIQLSYSQTPLPRGSNVLVDLADMSTDRG
jgi:hypothetical protein